MQQTAQRQQQIWLGCDSHLDAAGVEMAVQHGIQQLTALTPVSGRHRATRELCQAVQQTVVDFQPGQTLKNLQRCAGNRLQRQGGLAGLLAHPNGVSRSASCTDLSQGRAAQRGTAPVGRNVPVQRARNVGQNNHRKTKGFNDLAQFINICR
ncbi:hypothetical protein GALL_479500 [mine drainage metagenome]|uniref:Uncharacterized protein n=1 Tax=mine drainage metagenome TaxID=410659 RepID=A0A1J5PG91_9ZZZZ